MILSVFRCKNLPRGSAYSCGHHPMRLMSLDSIATDGNVVKKLWLFCWHPKKCRFFRNSYIAKKNYRSLQFQIIQSRFRAFNNSHRMRMWCRKNIIQDIIKDKNNCFITLLNRNTIHFLGIYEQRFTMCLNNKTSCCHGCDSTKCKTCWL